MASNVSAEIESLKSDIERSRTELEGLYLQLGEAAFSWHEAINYEPSQKAYESLVEVADKKAEIDRQIEALKTAVSEVSAGDKGIEQTEISMKALDKRYSILKASLGAVAIECSAAGRLPQRLQKCLEPMRVYEEKLRVLEQKRSRFQTAKKTLRVSILDKKVERLKGSLNEVFAETGERIYKSGDFRDVPGERARAILEEMEQIRFAKKNYKNDILDHRNMIDEAQGSLKNMGAFGEESRKLREMQSQRNLLADRMTDRYTEYGRVLAEGIPYWMDDLAPDELKRCCTLIIRQTTKMAMQNLNMEHLLMEKDIDIHNLQLSKLSEQMNHLNSQIQAIENQKAELQQKVDAELKAISDLRMRQNEISEKAARME